MLKKWLYARGMLQRGASLLTYTAMALVLVLLLNVFATLGIQMHQQRNMSTAANRQRVQALGSVLVRAIEIMLANDEISNLRRLIAEAGVEHELDICQLVLPDEGVAAAADPSHISVVELPKEWLEDTSLAYEESITDGYVNLRFPIQVPDRGSAILEISAPVQSAHTGGADALTWQCIVSGVALALMLGVYHMARRRFHALGAIHETLLAVRDGQRDILSLQLDPQLGPEAEAWNSLLGEQQGQQIRAALDQVKQSMHDCAEVSDDLAKACDALPIGMLLLDADLQTLYVNGAASVLLQTTVDNLRASSLTTVIDDARVHEAVTEAVSKGNVPRRVVELGAGSDDPSGVLRFTVRPIHAEGATLALVMVEDVTQQRVASAARDSFLAQATHELRSPLTSIRLYIEKAIEDTETSPGEVAQSLNVVNDESRRLERVVSEILSVSEIEAGSFHLERDDVRLDQMLEQLQKDQAAQAKQNGINLVFDVPPKLPVLHADRDKIAVALYNLVGNALKYTKKGGSVTVSVDTKEDQVSIDVIDTGLGIKTEEQERIFEKFYRAKDRRLASISGSGLGLAISRELIRLHGGDITVTSEIDRGSTFTLTMPIPQEVVEGGHSDSAVRSR